MRQIGKLSSRNSAEILSDYLLTQGIATKIEPVASGSEGADQWILWGLNEDQIDQSRAVLSEFEKDPDNTKYREAQSGAKTLRKQVQAEKTRRERQMFDANRLWSAPRLRDIPVVAGCILLSVGLSLATNFGHGKPQIKDAFYYRPQTMQDFGIELSDQDLSDVDFNATKGSFPDDNPGLSRIRELMAFIQKAPQHRPDIPEEAILKGQVWRLVTPIFLHFGGTHLLFNMIMLYNLGGVLEVRRGSWTILAMILTIAVFSNCAQAHYDPALFGGMSGVVYGLFVYLWLGGVGAPGTAVGVSRQQVVMMAFWMFLGFNTRAMHMANMAHLGGALTGGALVLVRKLARTFNDSRRSH